MECQVTSVKTTELSIAGVYPHRRNNSNISNNNKNNAKKMSFLSYMFKMSIFFIEPFWILEVQVGTEGAAVRLVNKI